ncbi:hypothetical protein A2917_02075 [Candidatus Nomurabacteria bacterium RIFCSPLOWO2_01_FULL_42_17]|uniref:Capsule synthesis protein CapA domain-containing protein n=1 Tax=Candidatus Nomurabacteria bacterium RIFCSPLOWO2_01_FULL_42_17 TaxID=1801780 RepID=A0A1F6XMQ2_9BACT|nr:MAG: hypothetical protein A2917_02075 [Candidatus Nomurabacteria bacterium RIFCSPLOWO2_01_FULL_42_17]
MLKKIKSKIKLGLWIVFPIILGVSLASFTLLVFKNFNGEKTIQPEGNVAAVAQAAVEEKPKYFYLNKTSEKHSEELKVGALAYLVGDLNTGEVILAKNQNQKLPIASISKLMTALVTNEIMTSDDIAQVSKKALHTEGTNGELRLGEKIKTSELLYPLLLESSNDAAEVLAEHFGRDSFIRKMNQEAQNLKMSDTKYEDPSGLSPNNQSTVSDIFKLAGYLNREKGELLSITNKRSFSNKKHSWSNISQFLHKDGYFGGKSGYTDPARETVVSLFSLPLAKSGTRPIAIALLHSPNRSKDISNILNYLEKNIYYGGEADASTDWIQQKIGAPNIKDPDFVTLTFGGDLMLDRGVRASVIKNFNNDYSALFEKLAMLKKSDIVFGNLEGTASDQGRDIHNLYSFRMDPAVVPAMRGAGISILSVANNHIGDWGRTAYVDTLARLKENEILYTGGGNNKKEAETPTIIEKHGMKIGFLGFSDVGPSSMEAGVDKAGQLLANDPRFGEIIQNASKQVDHLVVSLHFGDEYKNKHNARQEYLAHKAVDNGAKIVIGHHPHVIEDTEIYSRKDCTHSSCMSFIAYSLGNFIFDQSWSKPTMQGMLLQIKLSKDGSMTAKKDTVQLNSAFQPDQIIKDKEEKVKFQE